ncbi:uroporphyrinogen-III C-methyltransferase [Candidatus Cyanaurora vandensis]|uniref:uroporphyrinogen-III C-methyltransferase n=1 Tax=Candidatus Cyanaurora vandensis TaxID=2714958 RepID=UPI0037C12C10
MEGAVTLGKVYLVGAGPGDPGLLTLRAKALLEHADVVLYDALVSPEILQFIHPAAECLYAGKRAGMHSLSQTEIIALLLVKAQTAGVIVRLKGGDPFLFGRGGEELVALQAAGVPVEVVPGITAGMAAPAYLGVPLTHRGLSSSVAFVTGHEAVGEYQPRVDWAALARSVDTLVVYMGLQQLPQIVETLLQAGKDPATPILLIRWGTTPRQEHLQSTLAVILPLAQSQGFSAPAIIIIGPVVGLLRG